MVMYKQVDLRFGYDEQLRQCHQGTRRLCVLSANAAVSSVPGRRGDWVANDVDTVIGGGHRATRVSVDGSRVRLLCPARMDECDVINGMSSM
jgi:hypothetical protein